MLEALLWKTNSSLLIYISLHVQHSHSSYVSLYLKRRLLKKEESHKYLCNSQKEEEMKEETPALKEEGMDVRRQENITSSISAILYRNISGCNLQLHAMTAIGSKPYLTNLTAQTTSL